MKRKLLCGLFTICFLVACRDNSVDSTPASEHKPEDKYAASKSHLAAIIASCGDYDTESVAQLLGGKLWDMDNYYEYDENWEEMTFDLNIDGADGTADYRYVFLPSGVLQDLSVYPYPYPIDDSDRSKAWTFDPETRRLTIDGTKNYHLTALGENNLIWDFISTGSGFPRYCRQIFTARAIE